MALEFTATTLVVGIGATVGSAMLGIISFFFVRLVKSIDRMGKDIGEIKIGFAAINTKHDSLQEDIQEVQEDIKEIQKKVFK